MNAYATYTVLKTAPIIEACLDVTSDAGWLGGCIIQVARKGDIQTACYTEADRRASAHGATLQYLKAA